jgi:hypothetical protein
MVKRWRLLKLVSMRKLLAALSAEGPAHSQYKHGGYSRDAVEMRRLVSALTRKARRNFKGIDS